MKKISFLIIPLVLIACNNQSKIDRMSWLLGDWERKSANSNLYESWSKQDDSTYFGKSFMMMGSDTVFNETITLKLRDNQLYYIPK